MNINLLLGGCCESRNGGSCCDDREVLRKRGGEDMKVRNLAAQNCGVGVLFSINEKGELTVAALVPGSPAEQSTLVRVGDVLHRVDDQVVWCKSPQEVHRLVMGKEGTSVKLSFKMEGCHGLVHAQLQRRSVGAAERRKVVSQVAALRELSNARKGYASVPALSDITNSNSNSNSTAIKGTVKPIQGPAVAATLEPNAEPTETA